MINCSQYGQVYGLWHKLGLLSAPHCPGCMYSGHSQFSKKADTAAIRIAKNNCDLVTYHCRCNAAVVMMSNTHMLPPLQAVSTYIL